MEVTRLDVGHVGLRRVPYADVLVDANVVSLTPDQVASIEWAEPVWAEAHRVRVAAAVWIIEANGRRIVVDPAQAADDILRTGPDAYVHQEAVAGLLADAGCPRASVDTVIASHIDGIGMIAWAGDDGWSPFFPNAEVLVSRRELDAIRDATAYRPQGGDALLALDDQGVVTAIGDEHVVADGVTVVWTGGHCPGHQIVQIDSHGSEATLVGHLALTPLHCVCASTGHLDPAVATDAIDRLRDSRQLLAGPLWPSPGAARWTGNAMQAVAATRH